MTNINTSWWQQNKPRLALLPAFIFWAVSILCFVFGLSFENPTGYTIEGIDLSLIIAFALGLSNTMVQIVGNDQREKMDTLMFIGWIASYLFGIGSNVNFLYTVLNLSNPFVEFCICVGLGTMIEVLPEKLLVQFLDSLGKKVIQYQPQRKEDQQSRQKRHEQLRVTRTQPDYDLPEFLRNRGN